MTVWASAMLAIATDLSVRLALKLSMWSGHRLTCVRGCSKAHYIVVGSNSLVFCIAKWYKKCEHLLLYLNVRDLLV